MNKFNQQVVLSIAGVLATGVMIYWFINRGSEVVAAAGEKLNPASPKNVVYDNVLNGLGRSLTGDSSFDFGAKLYDAFNDSSWSWFGSSNGVLNPVSENNYPYRLVNGAGAYATENDNFDLGVWFYDLIHSDETVTNKLPSNDTPVSPIQMVNPKSPHNIVYSGANKLGAYVTKDNNFDLGAKIYSWFN